jgi:hypothetical protein
MMTEKEDCTILEVNWSGQDSIIQSKKVLQLALFGPLQNFWLGYKYFLALFSCFFVPAAAHTACVITINKND